MYRRVQSSEFAILVVHIVEVAVVLWVADKMIKCYDEQEKKLLRVEVYRAEPLSF